MVVLARVPHLERHRHARMERRRAGLEEVGAGGERQPPRAGAESAVIKGILDLHPAAISYVSCDPATLARDLKKLLAGGYAIDSIAAFDLFPQTHHVETVVRLS